MEYPIDLISAYKLALKYKEIEDLQLKSSSSTAAMTDKDSELDSPPKKHHQEDQDTDTKEFIEGLSFANAKALGYNCEDGRDSKMEIQSRLKKIQDGNMSRKKQVTMATMGIRQCDDDSDSDGLGGCNFLLNTIGKFQPITSTKQLVMTNNKLVPKNWILPDTQSTVHIFKNKDMLSDVNKATTGVQ